MAQYLVENHSITRNKAWQTAKECRALCRCLKKIKKYPLTLENRKIIRYNTIISKNGRQE